MTENLFPHPILSICLLGSLNFAAACSVEGPASEPDGNPSASGGHDGANGGSGASGGTSGGGQGNGGESTLETGGSGGLATGGSMGAGGTGHVGSGGNTSLPEPAYSFSFGSLDGWHVAPKADLIPGATAETTTAVGSVDSAALALTVPGNSSWGTGDYVGPGAHAIEVVKNGGDQLFGRYEFDVEFPSCGSGEELVSGLFTYFNDGSDEDEDGINDNSEIDIEHLCGDPQALWFTVWTDYEETPSTAFRRSTRAIDMRTGNFRETALGNGSFDDPWTNGKIEGLAINDFPVPGTFYTLGFEWTKSEVRYFIVLSGEEVELFKVSGEQYVPQRPAELLLNLWHPSSQWWDGGEADFPASTAVLRFDGVRIWTADQL